MSEAAMLPAWKKVFKPLYAPILDRSLEARMLLLLAKARHTRDEALVRRDYGAIWREYHARLDQSKTIDEWLFIKGFDDVDITWFGDGQVRRSAFDFVEYYVDQIVETLRKKFPQARSITEYGSGPGRISLALKKRCPEIECYAYELCEDGVEISRSAAKKFGVDVKFGQLDYIKDPESRYVHPKTDLAFTVFSLEQIPHASSVALKNMLDHTNLGTIHLEPVAENYPHSYWGMMGRLYTKRVDYLQNFDASARALPISHVNFRTLPKSHNPCIPAPSLYVLEK